MDQNSIKDKLKTVLATVLELEPDAINEDTSMDTVDAWDSLKQMKLIIVLEQEFGIEFDDEEVVELLSFRLIELSILDKLSVQS